VDVLSALDLHNLDEDVVAAARSVPADLRSLDAIHIGTALALRGEISAAVAYDNQLPEAARRAGLKVVAPGA
jgi:uncharacterized protein